MKSANLIAMVIGTMSAPSSFAGSYRVVDLGLGEGTSLNNSGQVTGEWHTLPYDTHPFLWDSGVVTKLGSLPDFPSTYPGGINGSGQIVGTAFDYDTFRDYAFLWDLNTGIRKIGPTDRYTSYATSINDLGQVVGSSFSFTGEQRGFFWQNDVSIDVGLYYATCINNSGQIGGSFIPSAQNFALHVGVWFAGAITDLGTLGGRDGYGIAINDAGQVAGYSDTGTAYHGFFGDASRGLQDLGTLEGGFESFAFGLNNLGQAVGRSLLPNGENHAFIWDNSNGMLDLNGFIPADSGWLLAQADAINDQGQITGYGVYNGEMHAFLLTPN